jgi:hypothetical protein
LEIKSKSSSDRSFSGEVLIIVFGVVGVAQRKAPAVSPSLESGLIFRPFYFSQLREF